ncbi:IKI3 family-domain-containing protein [Radiomyces spectabilis]|uniref:IKI3 family-domain-containing protein n=1 Tax=Radiomyces spectabilis TaxID=64574 RepID=UPI00221EAD1A|nr:IKI3 family-domain-containing protein [Radiomyces spectabilis]KAI8379248.1 IKI3 family-domain-containing protein [Radiomyces spectabilis]
MRSLQHLGYSCARITGTCPDARSYITSDPENRTVFVAVEDAQNTIRVLASTSASEGDPMAFVQLAEFPAMPQQNSSGAIVSFTYLSDLQVVCLATFYGDIMLISKEKFDRGEEAMEIVGTVDAGIHSMSWSPDQDLVVLITGEKNVLEMTQDFDTITEFPLHVEEEGEGVQHSVGWGRKETQFHGSEGKQAALKKVDPNQFTVSEDDDRQARIAWRGDGSFFVCSDIDPRKDARVLRIFNREGVLQNTSEPVNQLEHVLDWRPSGNLIVSSQRLPHKHDIVFFERNGLRHGEFTLRESAKYKLLELSWNADSTVLAIWIESETRTGKMQKSVQLWTANNYHWYLKQHIMMPEGEDIIGFAWDVENALEMRLVSSSGRYHYYSFAWMALTSTSVGEDNAGYVAVIDGASVLLTPFVYQNVPPPMCALTLKTDKNVQQVAFGPTLAGNRMAVLTTDKIYFFDVPADARGQVQQFELAFPRSDDNKSGVYGPPRQLRWINESQLVYVRYDEQTATDVLCIVHFEYNDSQSAVLNTVPLNFMVGYLHYNVNTEDLIAEAMDGSVYEVQMDESGSRASKIHQFPEFCPWIGTAVIGPQADTAERCVFGLTERSKLYVNDRLLSAECTSFYLRRDWLVFTTTSHTARFLPLDIEFDKFMLSDDIPDANDESYRRLERGSRIVLATHGKPALVLQMPRGNLETIQPRAFVLATIRKDVKNIAYRSAFIACRRNRIDLNILFDENPQQFFGNIEAFIEQIPEVDYLNLFLSTLKNEDTTLTMYRRRDHVIQVENKVNRICAAVRDTLMELGRDRYMQSILSTYVKSSPPDLESALLLLAEIKEIDLGKAEDALKYTIFLCKANKLYDVALGMYNFPLVLMVAQQAQMDPREYLPFLQELQSFDKYYQRFKIDDHLKRYEKALRNLAFAGDDRFDELVEYMQKHSLYLTALDEYANKPQQKKVILDVYGDHLMQTSHYEEAGILFTLAELLEKALQAYRMAGCWRETFSLAKQLQYSKEHVHALAYDLIEYLKDKRRYQDAASVANDYANDIEECVDSLLKGSLWQEAARMAHAKDRSDLIETHVKPGLIEGYTQMDEDIDEMKTQFSKQTARLKELRERKPEPTQVLPNDDTLDNIDMFSDTTSMYSQFTRYTKGTLNTSRTSSVSSVSSKASRKTSKLRRREERKRARGKKGTVFEEEYLVNSLKRLYEKASTMQADLGNLLRALVPFGYVEEARAIQHKFEGFLASLKEAMGTIFVPLQLASSQYQQEEGEEVPNQPVSIEKPVIADTKWKLQIL